MAKKNMLRLENERRRVHRIQQFVSSEFSAVISSENREFRARIIDFHFEGARLELNNPEHIPEKIDWIELFYGNKPISKIASPGVVFAEKGVLALNFAHSSVRGGMRDQRRHLVKYDLRPVALAIDPIRLKSSLHFYVNNFHAKGLQLDTSLSNKHLLKDMRINGLNILLPGVDSIKADVIIRHTSLRDGRLILGAEFLDISVSALENLARFSIFGTVSAEKDIGKKLKALEASFGPIKRMGPALKIENFSNPAELESILRVRFLAYHEAGIITDSTTPEEMIDEFDSRSIIVVAKLNGHVVGTVRLIKCVGIDDRFMFEKDIPFERLWKKTKREDYLEVSRLAIEPGFQNTDIVLRLFEEAARLTLINKKYAFCLARKSQQKSYRLCGFRPVSDSIKHPLLEGETLTVMQVKTEDFVKGTTMPALSWSLIARDATENMVFAGIVKKPMVAVLLPYLAKLQRIMLRFVAWNRKQKK